MNPNNETLRDKGIGEKKEIMLGGNFGNSLTTAMARIRICSDKYMEWWIKDGSPVCGPWN